MRRQDNKLHKLRYWREVLGLKQEDVALLLGCKTPNYCQKENGKIEVSRKEMLKIQMEFNKQLEKMHKPVLTLDEIFLP